MKKSLLDTLELPLALAHGVIGRLEIRIPWTNLLREPIIVTVDQVTKWTKLARAICVFSYSGRIYPPWLLVNRYVHLY